MSTLSLPPGPVADTQPSDRSDACLPRECHVPPWRTIDGCMALMAGKRFRHLPIIEEGMRIGIGCIGDAWKWDVRGIACGDGLSRPFDPASRPFYHCLADRAMYREKQLGRNRVEVAPARPSAHDKPSGSERLTLRTATSSRPLRIGPAAPDQEPTESIGLSEARLSQCILSPLVRGSLKGSQYVLVLGDDPRE